MAASKKSENIPSNGMKNSPQNHAKTHQKDAKMGPLNGQIYNIGLRGRINGISFEISQDEIQ